MGKKQSVCLEKGTGEKEIRKVPGAMGDIYMLHTHRERERERDREW